MSATFKVSQLVRPKHYQASQRLLNLQKPKSCVRSRPKNVYDMQDFRGLLHADYKDTIKCAYSKEYQSLSSTSRNDKEGIFVKTIGGDAQATMTVQQQSYNSTKNATGSKS